MGSRWLVFALAAACAAENSVFQISIPSDLYREKGYAHKEAMFGTPKYGVTLSQRLYDAGSTLCQVEGANSPWQHPYILMVDRGTCSFVTKVRNAQKMGAAGVVIADTKCLCADTECESDEPCEVMEPIMADDGSGADISIPAILLFKTDADKVKHYLRCGTTTGYCPTHAPANVVVQAQLEWAVPSPDARVEWELWTTAIDETGTNFLMDFKTSALALGKAQYFTPHFYVFNGTSYGCHNGEGQGDHGCGSLCTNGGRYCAPDPDGSMSVGISGADVVAENLRRACLWHLTGGGADEEAPQAGIGERWWDYIGNFSAKCGTMEHFNDPDCVQKALALARCDEAAIDKCMADAGGLTADAPNAILEAELEEVARKSVYVTPECFVNEAVIWGHLDAANVLSTICHGYARGSEPSACGCVDLASIDDERFEACLAHADGDPDGGQNTKKTNTGAPSSDDRVVSSGLPWWGAIVLVVAIVVVMLVAGLLYWKKTQQQMRDQVRGILAEYVPLEEMGGPGSIGMTGPPTTHETPPNEGSFQPPTIV